MGEDRIDIGDRALTRLRASECWTLLGAQSLARLAVAGTDGDPDIFPVNYLVHDGALYVRTGRGTKLARAVAHPACAVEIDGTDDGSWWSVVLRGRLVAVHDAEEFARSGIGQVSPWAPGEKPFAVKITPGKVSGRRFAVVPAGTVAPVEYRDPDPHVDRVDPPTPIPHHPPLDGAHR